jgi:Trypsin-like peptidase domain
MEWIHGTLSLLPPAKGARVAAFGYPRSVAAFTGSTSALVKTDATTTTGTVREVHHHKLDSSKCPFPCFETDLIIDSGMSGGPVIDEEGNVCGLLSASIPAYDANDFHTTWASTLWPLLGIFVDASWETVPPGTSYRLIRWAQNKLINTVGLEYCKIELTTSGDQFVCEYPADRYE